MSKTLLVKNAMLSVQRYPWEQGVCMQALYESGDELTAFAMAHDAVLRQAEDGRLAVTGDNIAVTDPAANGEVVYRAYLKTNDTFYKDASDKMLKYLETKAPRTNRNVLCHNEVSFVDGYTPDQIWADSIYMAPPFLAVMGRVREAYRQIIGMMEYLRDEESGLLYHIYDAGSDRFVRKKLWATGNGWALLGIARVIKISRTHGYNDIAHDLIKIQTHLLDEMLKYQLPDGRFHDILDWDESFVDGTSAMMVATAIYRGLQEGYLNAKYQKHADRVLNTMDQYVDEYGIIHEVCGCPHFVASGTSAESMAAYLMMHAWKHKLLT